MEEYWREGVDGISLNELCRRASVSKPGMYREFGGADGLMDAALEHYASTVLEPNAAQIDPAAPLREVLTAMVEMFTDPDRAGPAGCLLARMQHAPTQLGPTVAARVIALRDGARQRYAELIELAKERGEIPPDVPTDVAAAMIDIQCNALLMRMATEEDPAVLRAQALLAFDGLTDRTRSA